MRTMRGAQTWTKNSNAIGMSPVACIGRTLSVRLGVGMATVLGRIHGIFVGPARPEYVKYFVQCAPLFAPGCSSSSSEIGGRIIS
jgi:hypothetical protein